MADMAVLLPLNIQGSFAGFWVRTQHCGHTEDTQEKKKRKSTNWNFSIWGLENSFNLGSDAR